MNTRTEFNVPQREAIADALVTEGHSHLAALVLSLPKRQAQAVVNELFELNTRTFRQSLNAECKRKGITIEAMAGAA